MKKYVLNQKIVAKEIEGNIVLIDMANSTYFTFNRVGSEVVRLIQEGKNLDEILSELCTRYSDVESGIIQEDVSSVLKDAEEKNLIREEG